MNLKDTIDDLKDMVIKRASEQGIGRNTAYRLLSEAIDDCGPNIYDSLSILLNEETRDDQL